MARDVVSVDLLARSLTVWVSADDMVVAEHSIEPGTFEGLGHFFQKAGVVTDVAVDEHRPESHDPGT